MFDQWEAIDLLSDSFRQLLLATLLCSARLFATFSILQATSDQALQGRVRSGVVIIIALFIGAGQPANLAGTFDQGMFVVLALKEALIGMVLGYMAATVFWVAEGVGAMIDNVAGYNNVQQQNPLNSSQSTPISNLLLQLCVTLFYTFGGFLILLDALFETYKWWPINSVTPLPAKILERFIILQTDTLMTQVVKIASPVLIIMLLIDLAFGLIAKTAGKLEPNALAQPVKSATALLLVMLSLSVFIQQLATSLSLSDFKQQLQIWLNIGNSRF